MVVGAGHFNDLSPVQKAWFGIFQWWVLLAPPCVLGGVTYFIFRDDSGPLGPRQQFWLHAFLLLAAACTFLVSWGGVRLILSVG